MKELIPDYIEKRIYGWLLRKTTNSAVRRVGELPLAIGSDVGIMRGENQDRVAVLRMQEDQGKFFMIVALCDGMGGMAEGSACAAQTVASFFMACIRHKAEPLSRRLLLAAQEANQTVYSLYKGRGGATLSAILFDDVELVLGVNVGDSRIYKYQANVLEQISIDDTMAGILNNDLSYRNELLQFIGMGDGLEPHVIEIPVPYDSLVITSDGVHFIDKQVMQLVVQSAKDSALTIRRLLEISKWCGGRDNSSMVAAAPFSMPLQLQDESGTLQIWDPFGELQIVLPGLTGTNVSENELSKDLQLVVKQSPMEENKKKDPKSKKKSKATGGKTPPKDKVKGAEETRPLLNIYFNDDTGKDNNG